MTANSAPARSHPRRSAPGAADAATTRTRRSRRVRDEGGSAVVELAVLAPAFGLILALIIAGGRLAVAHQGVESAAGEAARTASIARTPSHAAQTAAASARSTLIAQRTRCLDIAVEVDTTGFATAVGAPASVGATVTCRLDLAGLLPGLPGSMNVTATVRSPLDTYRERE